MAMGKKGLGKGLDALLGDYNEPQAAGLQEMDIYLIDTNEGQPARPLTRKSWRSLRSP